MLASTALIASIQEHGTELRLFILFTGRVLPDDIYDSFLFVSYKIETRTEKEKRKIARNVFHILKRQTRKKRNKGNLLIPCFS